MLPNLAASWSPLAIEIVWKATLLLLATAGIAWALRSSSAAVRHLLWSVGLCAALVLPVALLALPSWRVALLPAERAAPAQNDGPKAGAVQFDEIASTSRPPSVSPSTLPSPSPSSLSNAPRLEWRLSLVETLFVAWLAGVAALMLWLISGFLAVRSLTRRALAVGNAGLLQELDRARVQLGITRAIRLLQTRDAVTPLTFGFRRSTVVLPADAVQWSATRQRIVLLHELAHIRRHDVLLQLVAQITCAVYWFHPLVWYAARALRAEREHACDDAVVRAGERPSEYATHLLDVARAYRGTALLQPAALAMARPSQLEGRLLAVLKPDVNRTGITGRRIALSALGALAVILPLSAFTPAARERAALPSGAPERTEAPVQSAEVTVHPDPKQPLGARFNWAFEQAPRRANRNGYWVGYAIRRSERGNQAYVSGFNTNELSGRPLQTQLFGTRPREAERAEPVERDVAILFHFDRSGRRLEDATVMRIHSTHIGMNLRGAPVLWLGHASDAQSIEWLKARFEDTNVAWMRDEMIEAVGVHQRADLAVPFLQKVARESSVTEHRVQAAEALGEQGSPSAIDVLKQLVRGDASPAVRREATEALGRSTETSATVLLFQLAQRSDDKDVRLEATEALGEQGTPAAAGALEQLAFEGDMNVMREAAEAVAELPPSLGFRVLKRIIEEHPRWEIRAEAAESLGELPADLALPVLERMVFNDPSVQAQEDAVEALAGLGKPAREALRRIIRTHPNKDVRAKAIEENSELENTDNENPNYNYNTNSNSNSDTDQDSEEVRVVIDESQLISEAEARRAVDSNAILALRSGLNHEKQHSADLVRERSVWALSLVRNGEVVRPLMAALSDPDWRVRAYAAWALDVVRDPRALEVLMIATKDNHWRVRAHAVAALGELRGEDGRRLAHMIAALDDPAWQVRAAAADNLGNFGAAAEDALKRLVTDSHMAVRGAAETSLARLVK